MVTRALHWESLRRGVHANGEKAHLETPTDITTYRFPIHLRPALAYVLITRVEYADGDARDVCALRVVHNEIVRRKTGDYAHNGVPDRYANKPSRGIAPK